MNDKSKQLQQTPEQQVFDLVEKYLNHQGINRELRATHMAIKENSRLITCPLGIFEIKVKKI